MDWEYDDSFEDFNWYSEISDYSDTDSLSSDDDSDLYSKNSEEDNWYDKNYDYTYASKNNNSTKDIVSNWPASLLEEIDGKIEYETILARTEHLPVYPIGHGNEGLAISMIIHHVKTLSLREKRKLPERIIKLIQTTIGNSCLHIPGSLQEYFCIFYQKIAPVDAFTLILRIWRSYPKIAYHLCEMQFNLTQPSHCKKVPLLTHKIKSLIDIYTSIKWNHKMEKYRVLLQLLNISLQTKHVALVRSSAEQHVCSAVELFPVFVYHIKQSHKDNLPSIAKVIDYFDFVWDKAPDIKLEVVLLYSVELLKEHFIEYKEFILHHQHFILYMAGNMESYCNMEQILLYILYWTIEKKQINITVIAAQRLVNRCTDNRIEVRELLKCMLKKSHLDWCYVLTLTELLQCLWEESHQKLDIILECCRYLRKNNYEEQYVQYILLHHVDIIDNVKLDREDELSELLFILRFLPAYGDQGNQILCAIKGKLLQVPLNDYISYKLHYSLDTYIEKCDDLKHISNLIDTLDSILRFYPDMKMTIILLYGDKLIKADCKKHYKQFILHHAELLLTRGRIIDARYFTALYFLLLYFVSNKCLVQWKNIEVIGNILTSCDTDLKAFKHFIQLCEQDECFLVPKLIDLIISSREDYSDTDMTWKMVFIFGNTLMDRKCYREYKQLIIQYGEVLTTEQFIPFYACKKRSVILLAWLILIHHYVSTNQTEKSETLFSQWFYHCSMSSEYHMIFRSKDEFRSIYDQFVLINDGDETQLIKFVQHLFDECTPRLTYNAVEICFRRWKKTGNDSYRQAVIMNKQKILNAHLQIYPDGPYIQNTCIALFILLDKMDPSNENKEVQLILHLINKFKGSNADYRLRRTKSTAAERISNIEENICVENISFEDVITGEKCLKDYLQSCTSLSLFFFKSWSKLFKLCIQEYVSHYQYNGLKQFLKIFNELNLPDKLEKKHKFWLQFILTLNLNQNEIADIILYSNMTDCKTDFLKTMTLQLGKLMRNEIPDEDIDNDNMESSKSIIYKSFCILRQAKKDSDLEKFDLDQYYDYYDFIDDMDREEEIKRMLKRTMEIIVLVLLLLFFTSSCHHKSAELKKYLSLKYEYEDLILYLLWCSGDIHINPGPTFSKIRPLHDCEKERNWVKEMCGNILKLFKGIDESTKPKSLWKEKPEGWPDDKPFYDPNNKSKVKNGGSLSDDDLLNCLLDFCENKKLCLPDTYQEEIKLWRGHKKKDLYDKHIYRKEMSEIKLALHNLKTYKDSNLMGKRIKEMQLILNFDSICQVQMKVRSQRSGEITSGLQRDFACTICKIVKGLCPEEKSDGIWKSSPKNWPQSMPFYSPHNEKKRDGKGQDKALIHNLLQYCVTHSIVIPEKYHDMVTAWKKGNTDELAELQEIQTNISKLEHSLKYMEVEGLLSKQHILDGLKNIGITLADKYWKCNSQDNSEIKDSTQAKSRRNRVKQTQTSASEGKLPNCLQSQVLLKSTKASSNQISKDNVESSSTRPIKSQSVLNQTHTNPLTFAASTNSDPGPGCSYIQPKSSMTGDEVTCSTSPPDKSRKRKSDADHSFQKKQKPSQETILEKRESNGDHPVLWKQRQSNETNSEMLAEDKEETLQRQILEPAPPMSTQSQELGWNTEEIFSVMGCLTKSEENCGDTSDSDNILPDIDQLE